MIITSDIMHVFATLIRNICYNLQYKTKHVLRYCLFNSLPMELPLKTKQSDMSIAPLDHSLYLCLLPLLFFAIIIIILLLCTLSNITLRVFRRHGEHVQGGTLQWTQQAAGHRAQHRAEDEREGSVGQQA